MTKTLVWLMGLSPLATMGVVALAGEATSRPNIVLFLSDDHGYRDSGVYSNSDVRTPNIDRLAREGMRFTDRVDFRPIVDSFGPTKVVFELGQCLVCFF